MPPITNFHGEYNFLSNFAPSPLTYEGERYRTVEHAFQAAKTFDPAEQWVGKNHLGKLLMQVRPEL